MEALKQRKMHYFVTLRLVSSYISSLQNLLDLPRLLCRVSRSCARPNEQRMERINCLRAGAQPPAHNNEHLPWIYYCKPADR